VNPEVLQIEGSRLFALGSLGWSKSRVLRNTPKTAEMDFLASVQLFQTFAQSKLTGSGSVGQ
jgi:hypothetical protein